MSPVLPGAGTAAGVWVGGVRHYRAATRWIHQDAHHMMVVYGPLCGLLYLLVWRHPGLVVALAPWCAAYCAAATGWAWVAVVWKRRPAAGRPGGHRRTHPVSRRDASGSTIPGDLLKEQ